MLDWLKSEQNKSSEMCQETNDRLTSIHNNFKENFSKCCKNMTVLSSSALLENELINLDILKKKVNKSQLKHDVTKSTMTDDQTRTQI